MSRILVDSSVWISFFKGTIPQEPFFELIDENKICVNELILTEIVPALRFKKERHLIDILLKIECYELKIDWTELIEYQSKNLDKGINKIGIPDLIIMQNAIQNNLKLYSLDSHFKLMSKLFPIQLFY